MEAATIERSERASTLELFFDLVFVFTITQLTGLLADRGDWEGVAQIALILLPTWWIYGGYLWLTNAVAPAQYRLLLLGGMGGFLIMALAVPTAFAGSGLTFGLAYALVIVLHSGLYIAGSSDRETAAIKGLSPFNVGSALVILVGGALGGDAQWVLWTVAAIVLWTAPWLTDQAGFVIGVEHFVERRGLVMIIALGESIIAIGIGAEGLAVDAALVSAALAGLALIAALWWTYFSDEKRVARALAAVGDARRATVALLMDYAHLFLLAGVVAVAAGIKKAIAHPYDPLADVAAWELSVGVALFLVADVGHRAVLAIHRGSVRAAAAALALPLVLAGTEVAAVAQVAGLALLICLALALEARSEARAASSLAVVP